MRSLTLKKIASYMGGKVITRSTRKPVSKIVTGFSTLVPQCVLLVRYNIGDVELFVAGLKERLVSGIIIEKPSPSLIETCTQAGIGIIQAKTNFKALYDCARLQRRRCEIPFVQVIGSSGKTTTKEMIASVLQPKIPIIKTIKNYNFPSEIAKNILKVTERHGAAILEVGMTAPEMMELSSSMIKPDIAVVTSIHRAHLMRFGSIENIISAKAQVLRHLSKRGTLIINGEDENCKKFLQKCRGRKVLTFGFSNRCDIWASDIKYEPGRTLFKAVNRHFSVNCSLQTFGKYNISNALAAILVGIKLGLNLEDIINGLAKFKPVKNRMEIINADNGVTIINDNYNANPDSTKLLLNDIPAFAQNRPVILVMGDMENPKEEIGNYASKVHFEIGQEAAKIPFLHMIAVGKWAKNYLDGALDKGISATKLHHFRYLNTARAHLQKFIVPDSIVIFKSSPYVKVRALIPAISKKGDSSNKKQLRQH